MGEVYLGTYRVSASGDTERMGAEWVGKPADADALTADAWDIVGNGWALYEDVLCAALGIAAPRRRESGVLHARDALALARPRFVAGEAMSALDLRPNYLRQRVALTLSEQAQLRAAR
jgi:tRNA threonylcarbamoyladenosine biosynthesis protein TsaB